MNFAYLIAGSGGMLGSALQVVLAERGDRFLAPPESEFDITDPTAVASVCTAFSTRLSPGERGILINAAAYTDVARAETQPELAYRVNELGALLLAEAARDAGLGFIHVSTDFVFDGTKHGPYVESDEPRPLQVYGASKLAGERAVLEVLPGSLVARTAWVFGPNGSSFPQKILELARQRDEIPVVTDEVGSPTYTVDLARGVLALHAAEAAGVYHLTNVGSCSRLELAVEVLRAAGLGVRVVPVSADDYPSSVARPRSSVLDCSRAAALGVHMPHWRDAVARFVASTRP